MNLFRRHAQWLETLIWRKRIGEPKNRYTRLWMFRATCGLVCATDLFSLWISPAKLYLSFFLHRLLFPNFPWRFDCTIQLFLRVCVGSAYLRKLLCLHTKCVWELFSSLPMARRSFGWYGEDLYCVSCVDILVAVLRYLLHGVFVEGIAEHIYTCFLSNLQNGLIVWNCLIVYYIFSIFPHCLPYLHRCLEICCHLSPLCSFNEFLVCGRFATHPWSGHFPTNSVFPLFEMPCVFGWIPCPPVSGAIRVDDFGFLCGFHNH